jgi:BlaI family transcriptional regulator, penicillinase repressor
MAKVPQVSEAEWEVIKALWDHGPLTSGDVVQRVTEAKGDWAPRTIKTLLARLVKKGAVGVQQQEKRTLYVAKVTREALIKRESRSFITRVFDGAVTPALVHFLREADLTPQQVNELKKILNQERT